VLCVPVDPMTVAGLDAWLRDAVATEARKTLLHANAHGINQAQGNLALRAAYREADGVYCDGTGVLLAARLLGVRVPERITGADWLWHLHDVAVASGWHLFLLGAAPGVASRAAEALETHSGSSCVVGSHHGFFEKTGPENDEVLERLRSSALDVVLVAFGMPLQEEWIRRYRREIPAAVVISVGGAFDYVAGDVRRGPRWMVDHGFEWLARLAVEPRRLASRYMIGNPVFVSRVLMAWVMSRRWPIRRGEGKAGPGRRRYRRPSAIRRA
jgi:N-acetylglucosaminyldiphosphoundecaprenol N-acetyl-beta-D-mannosaminyltransferase